VQRGILPSGFAHWAMFGRKEGRKAFPALTFDGPLSTELGIVIPQPNAVPGAPQLCPRREELDAMLHREGPRPHAVTTVGIVLPDAVGRGDIGADAEVLELVTGAGDAMRPDMPFVLCDDEVGGLADHRLKTRVDCRQSFDGRIDGPVLRKHGTEPNRRFRSGRSLGL